jgi:hypothetical protein
VSTPLFAVLVVIASILFYRLVSRHHKVLLAKTAGGIIVLLLLIALIATLIDARRTARADAVLRSVGVRYVPTASDQDVSADSSINPSTYFERTVDTLTSVSFELCNNGMDTVAKVVFFPRTKTRGRSSAYTVAQQYINRFGKVTLGDSYSDNRFSSDFILAPDQCTILTWSGGTYVVRDTVTVRNESVEFMTDVRLAP